MAPFAQVGFSGLCRICKNQKQEKGDTGFIAGPLLPALLVPSHYHILWFFCRRVCKFIFQRIRAVIDQPLRRPPHLCNHGTCRQTDARGRVGIATPAK